MYARSMSRAEISAATGIGLNGVDYHMKKIRKEIAHRIADLDAVRSEQLESLRRIRTEGWEGWQRSCQPAETTVAEKTTGGAGKGLDGTKTQLRRVGQAGDASFLGAIDRALDGERKLLGLNAPTKLEHAGQNGGPISFATLLTVIRQPEDASDDAPGQE